MFGLAKFKNQKHILSSLALSFNALGSIYGDLGTSPLYTIEAIFPLYPTNENELLGGISLIFWLFTFMVIIKYGILVLYYGPNDNEGGQIAIYSKLARHLAFKNFYLNNNNNNNTEEKYDSLLSFTRANTIVPDSLNTSSSFAKNAVSFSSLTTAILGCSLVMSDGLLTPTTSVLSAIGGITLEVPSFTNKVMPVSVAVIILLFAMQKFGSGKLSFMFAPIIFLWLLLLFINGCSCISKHPSVMKALNPKFAFDLLKKNKNIDIIAPVMLSITGTEAMFADVGHFGSNPIRFALIIYVYPCLMVCYFGQAAYILDHPNISMQNIFYQAIPFGKNYYWFVFVVSTLATIIASQALILGVFSILKQLIALEFFPRLNIIYTSSKHKGRVFIPLACFVLMILVVLTTVGFKTSNRVTAAYGLGISIDFILTTYLTSLTIYYVYNYNIVFPIVFFLIFASIEVCLIIAGLKKIIHGAWFSIMVCLLMFSFISFWRYCRVSTIKAENRNRKSINSLFDKNYGSKKKPMDYVLDHNDRDDGKHEDRNSDESTSADLKINPIMVNHSSGFKTTTVFKTGSPLSIVEIPKIFFIYCSIDPFSTNFHYLPGLIQNLINDFRILPQCCILIENQISTYPTNPTGVFPATLIPFQDSNKKFEIKFYRCLIKSGFMKQTKIDHSLINEILEQIGIDSSSIVRGELSISHIFERNEIDAKLSYNTDIGNSNNNNEIGSKIEMEPIKNKFLFFLSYPFWFARTICINYLYAPLNYSSMDFMMSDKLLNNSKNEEILYLGERVEI